MSIPNSVPTRRMSASISSRWSGSSPLVGSSRSTSLGSWAIAEASFTRWRCPVDIVPIGRKRSSPRSTCQSASLARWIAAFRGMPWSSARWRTRSAAWTSGGRLWCSGAYPIRARISSAAVFGSFPSTASAPSSLERRPSTSEMSVVLPAPFGPSSPVIPWPISTVRRSSATVAPNRFVTPSARTTDVAAPSGTSRASRTSLAGRDLMRGWSQVGDGSPSERLAVGRPRRDDPVAETRVEVEARRSGSPCARRARPPSCRVPRARGSTRRRAPSRRRVDASGGRSRCSPSIRADARTRRSGRCRRTT